MPHDRLAKDAEALFGIRSSLVCKGRVLGARKIQSPLVRNVGAHAVKMCAANACQLERAVFLYSRPRTRSAGGRWARTMVVEPAANPGFHNSSS